MGNFKTQPHRWTDKPDRTSLRFLFNTKTGRAGINKHIQDLPPPKAKYKFFSGAHGTFSKTDYMLGHNSVVHKVTEIPSHIKYFSEQNVMKVEINKKKRKKSQEMLQHLEKEHHSPK